MRRTLKLNIIAGQTTCYSKDARNAAGVKGVMCPCVMTTHWGTRWHCKLFSEWDERSGGMSPLHEKDHMLQRLPECLEAEEE